MCEQLLGTFTTFELWDFCKFHWQHDIIESGEVWDQVVVLKHKPDFAAAIVDESVIVHLGDVFFADDDAAFTRRVEGAE